jgi:hypothetical protein
MDGIHYTEDEKMGLFNDFVEVMNHDKFTKKFNDDVMSGVIRDYWNALVDMKKKRETKMDIDEFVMMLINIQHGLKQHPKAFDTIYELFKRQGKVDYFMNQEGFRHLITKRNPTEADKKSYVVSTIIYHTLSIRLPSIVSTSSNPTHINKDNYGDTLTITWKSFTIECSHISNTRKNTIKKRIKAVVEDNLRMDWTDDVASHYNTKLTNVINEYDDTITVIDTKYKSKYDVIEHEVVLEIHMKLADHDHTCQLCLCSETTKEKHCSSCLINRMCHRCYLKTSKRNNLCPWCRTEFI